MKYKLFSIVCISVVLISGMFFLIFGNRPTKSESEKRELASFPKFSINSLFNGNFTNGMVKWFSDTVPNRTEFLQKSAGLKSLFGVKKDGVTIIGGDGISAPEEAVVTEVSKTPVEVVVPEKTVTKPSVTTTYTQAVVTTVPLDKDIVINDPDGGVNSGGIIVYEHRGMMMFQGTSNAGANYAAYLNAFKADLGTNVNVYSMVAPTAQSFYMPKKWLDRCSSESNQMTNIRNLLDGVIDVNIFPTFMEHREEDIYLRTDHHWAAMGAYYAAEQFAKAAKVNFLPISTYEKIEWKDYLGTFDGYSEHNPDIVNFPETFYAYKPAKIDSLDCQYYTTSYKNPTKTKLIWEDVTAPNAYICYMGGDEKINDIKTTLKTGRTLALFKDSYGNALQPFLTDSFDRIIVIDIRYFKLNAIEFLKQENVTDVLFCMNTFSAFGSNAKHIDKIRTQ
jgi:hypothetical protein